MASDILNNEDGYKNIKEIRQGLLKLQNGNVDYPYVVKDSEPEESVEYQESEEPEEYEKPQEYEEEDFLKSAYQWGTNWTGKKKNI